nr:MAG TPA: hypothetical protein [Bacteriophage sp.]
MVTIIIKYIHKSYTLTFSYYFFLYCQGATLAGASPFP